MSGDTMKTISIADAATGLFTGSVKTLHASLVAANVPAGCVAVDGRHDAQRSRLDLASGEVVPWLPPAPADNERATYALNEAGDGWVARPRDAVLAAQLRAERARRINACDWTELASARGRLGPALHDAWQAYRQALRDLPEQPGWPREVSWPQEPGATAG